LATYSRSPSPGDRSRCALLHDLAFLEHEEAIGEHECLEGVMGDEEAWSTEVGEVATELGLYVKAGPRIERRQGFVEQQQCGVSARARASATRWACPPDRSAGRRPAKRASRAEQANPMRSHGPRVG
jgi:hypothetical protein